MLINGTNQVRYFLHWVVRGIQQCAAQLQYFLDDLGSLPAEAQRRVSELVALLKERYRWMRLLP
jgi:hypothetical protein